MGPGQFLSDLIASGAVPVVHLTEVFRQAANSRIVRSAHQINQGVFPTLPGKGEESDFYMVAAEEPETIAQTIVDLVKTRLPRKFGLDPVRDIQVLCPMNRGITGARGLNQMLRARLGCSHSNVRVPAKWAACTNVGSGPTAPIRRPISRKRRHPANLDPLRSIARGRYGESEKLGREHCRASPHFWANSDRAS